MTPLTAAQLQERFHSEVMRGIHAGTVDVKFGVELLEDHLPQFWARIPPEDLPTRWWGGVLRMLLKLIGILMGAHAKRHRADRARHWQNQVAKFCQLAGIPERHNPLHCRTRAGAARVLFNVYTLRRPRQLAPVLGCSKRHASLELCRARKARREAKMMARVINELGIDGPQ